MTAISPFLSTTKAGQIKFALLPQITPKKSQAKVKASKRSLGGSKKKKGPPKKKAKK